MREQHQGLRMSGSAIRRAARLKGRDTSSRSSQPLSLALVQPQPDHEDATMRYRGLAETPRPGVPGQLAIRWERQDVTAMIMWLSGWLDQATVTLLDHEVDGRALGSMSLVVDLTGLECIDSPGLDALVGIHWRAAKRGDRLSFRHGSNVAQRPVELTRIARLRSRWATAAMGTDDTFYFALAMACVDVDHPRFDDRPEAA
jgi:anti-anti-sigma regulatory factor